MLRYFYYIILFTLLFITNIISQNIRKIDSLFSTLKKWENEKSYQADTILYNVYYKLGRYLQNQNPDTAIFYLKKSQEKARKLNNIINLAESTQQIAWCLFLKGENQKAIETFEQALNLLPKLIENKYRKIKKKEYGSILGNLGAVYHVQGNFNKALECYFNALKMNEACDNKFNQANNLANIGIIYASQKNYAKALEYYTKALHIDKEIENKDGQASDYINIGIIHEEQGHYRKAIKYYFMALKIIKELENNKRNYAIVLGNIGNLYVDLGEHEKAMYYLTKAMKINKEVENKWGLISNFVNIGTVYSKQQKYTEAEQYLLQAIQIGEELQITNELKDYYKSLSELYVQMGKHKEALNAYKKHILYKDSVNSEENKKALATKEMQYQFEKKQDEEKAKHEQELLKREAKEKQQRLYLYLALAIAAAILVILGIVYKSLQTTKRQKKIIEQARDEIAAQKKIVEEKNKDILDSINYAKRIQEAILPHPNKWKQLFPDSFILYLPKDIVAGDFYWLEETDQYIFVAAADCTGHGVPGAMVSVVCSNALTRAVLEEKLTETNQILDKVREIVIEKLSGSDENIRDGMDVCLIRINKQNRKQIQYSGANRPLYIAENNILIEIKPDKQPIGKYEEAMPFTAQQIELKENTTLYLTTDGYADQFGGEKGKKIGTKQFKELLSSLVNKTMEEQKKTLETFYVQWRGEGYQTDDVTLIGIKI
ncbi:MAG: hypothetical protein KatS3mg027_1667 [Bacteroidia bacterium]|nr:MAG: hypothetical protein KatS3mg027_1667 [Bacteroidia bacterium]